MAVIRRFSMRLSDPHIDAFAGSRVAIHRYRLTDRFVNHPFAGVRPSLRRPVAYHRLVTVLFEDDARRQNEAGQAQDGAGRPHTERDKAGSDDKADHAYNNHERPQHGSTFVRHEHDSGAIGNDFAHGLAHFGGIEAHHDDTVGAHGGRVSYHSVDGLPAGLFQQLRIFMNLAAGDRAQPGHDIAADAAAAHDDSKTLSDGLLHAVPRNMFRRRNQHEL